MTHTPITLHLTFIRKPIIKNKPTNTTANWQDSAHQWKALLVTDKGQESFDYYTGAGWVAHGEPKKPSLDDILHSLVIDASAQDTSFEDWASELGYDTDSRKSLDIYLACQANALKLRKLGINIEKERERLQDY